MPNDLPITWIMDTKIKHSAPMSNYIDSDIPLWVIFCWPIIFVIIVAILVYKTTKSIRYNNNEKTALKVGVVISVIILFIYSFFDSIAPFIYFDSNSKDFLRETITRDWDQQRYAKKIITHNNIFMKTKKEKNDLSYAVPTALLQKLERENKIKTMDFNKWAIKQSVAHKYIDSAELKKNVQYEYSEIQQHTERLVVIMLTVAFIVAIWDIKIFDKLSIWIYTTILIELIATATWFHYTSFRQRSEYLYIVKNIQVITSCLGSLVLFLFYGASKL